MQSNKKDTTGLWLSGLCIVHCIATPVLFLLAGSGLLVSAFSSEWVHLLLITPMLLLIYATVVQTALRGESKTPLLLAIAGMAILIASLTVHGLLESALGIVGGSLVFSAHWLNRRLACVNANPNAVATEREVLK